MRREGASEHRIKGGVAKVQKGFNRIDGGREGSYSPLEYRKGRREGYEWTREQSRGSGPPRQASTGMVGQPPALTLPCSPRRGLG